MVKVSIIVPVYNVQRYLKKCMDSIVDQTLQDIEIICVDDGSTDASGSILDDYAAKDSRVRVIHQKNSGYGYAMNVGVAAAGGEYIGIVESDDFADAEMFGHLYEIAHKNQLDVVKSSFYYYDSQKKERNEKCEIVSPVLAGKTICPSTFFSSKLELVEFYNIKPTIWSAIYRSQFIKENKITFLETPGASYQDAGFSFKVMALAKRVQLLQEAFLHYRQDNMESSVNSKGKVFCVCDEYAEMHRFLEEHPVERGRLEYVLQRIKYDTYMWNYERIGQKYQYIFLERASMEFREGLNNGSINKEYFEWYKWENLNRIARDPAAFYTKRALSENKENLYWKKEYERLHNSVTYRIGNAITILPRLIRRTCKCLQRHGIKYTFTVSLGEWMGGKKIV